VPYLDAVVLDTEPDPGWTRCDALLRNDQPLDALLGPDRSGRAVRDRAVAASVLFQGYAVRILGTVAAAWLLTGRAPDVSPATTAIAWHTEMPARLGFLGAVQHGDDLAWVLERAFERHLDVLAERVSDAVAIGRRLLWGNAAAALMGACNAIEMSAPPTERAPLSAAVDRLLRAMPHGLPALGERRVVPLPEGYGVYWARHTCCLWFREDPARALCDSCNLLADDERHRRCAARLAS